MQPSIDHSSQSTLIRRKAWEVVLLAGLFAGLAVRVFLAREVHTPGLWDAAFYYTVAKNIALGRGQVIDYLWHFINGGTPLTHYSSDFWHPLTSQILALPMRLFGISVFNALIPSILSSLGIAVVVYALGKTFGLAQHARTMAALLAWFAPYAMQTSLTTDSIIFFSLITMIMLYFIILGRASAVYFLPAAVLSGLGHLTRQDGILLLGTILICIFLTSQPFRKKLLLAGFVVGIHLLVLSPLLARNYQEMQHLLPPGPPTTRFLTEHDDVYAFGKTLTFQTYWQEFGLAGILQNKLHTAYFHVLQGIAVLDPLVVLLLGWAVIDFVWVRRQKERFSFFIPVLIYAGLSYFFYIFIASFALFSAQKSLVTVMSFAALLMMDFMDSRIRYRPLLIGLWFGMVLYLGVTGMARTTFQTSSFDAAYERISSTQALISADRAKRGLAKEVLVVMTSEPWQYHEAAGVPTVMIPNNDLEVIFQVADLYGVSYIVLPAPRTALQGIYAGKETSPRLELIGSFEENKVYRILPASRGIEEQ